MRKKILTFSIISGLLLSPCIFTSAFGAENLTRKQKKEVVLLDAASVFFEEKQYDAAIEYYNEVIELNPYNAEAYSKRGNSKYEYIQIK